MCDVIIGVLSANFFYSKSLLILNLSAVGDSTSKVYINQVPLVMSEISDFVIIVGPRPNKFLFNCRNRTLFAFYITAQKHKMTFYLFCKITSVLTTEMRVCVCHLCLYSNTK